MTPIFFNLTQTEKGQFISANVGVETLGPAPDTHPNFKRLKQAALDALDGIPQDADVIAPLFDVAKQIEVEFKRLTERITVKNGKVCLDGDTVEGPLQDQILDFLDKGEDFTPLVNFYEKLLSNPLGNVREGLYTYMRAQQGAGHGFAITPDGDILGYKGVTEARAEWRLPNGGMVYIPSQRGEGIVNGRDVAATEYIEQLPGDRVEMPRSKVLNQPSAACGDGLHVGTYKYASTFMRSVHNKESVTFLVRFSPAAIVSLPDSMATFKIRVCGYTVVGPVTEPVQEAVLAVGEGHAPEQERAGFFEDESEDTDPCPSVWDDDDDEEKTLPLGTRVVDPDGDIGVVIPTAEYMDPEDIRVEYEEDIGIESMHWTREDLTVIEDDTPDLQLDGVPSVPDADGEPLRAGDRVVDWDGDEGTVDAVDTESGKVSYTYDDKSLGTNGKMEEIRTAYNDEHDILPIRRVHGHGGPTSQQAKGRGKNPHQDEAGRFSGGRPGSQRDSGTGRFTG